MEFEFDNHKSGFNRREHGIDFLEAQMLWNDPDRIEIPARTIDEPRYLVVGKIGDEYWSAIITYRAGTVARRPGSFPYGDLAGEVEIYEGQ